MPDKNNIDIYVPQYFRTEVNNQYYNKVNQHLNLEEVIADRNFLENPLDHLALYTDHGVVHVTNVTQIMLDLIDKVNGVLIPKRNEARLEFMKGFGCVLSYIHDVGMINLTPFGRATHAEYLPHAVFSTEFDQLINLIWDRNIGGISWNIINLSNKNIFSGPQLRILRELLSFGYCHSKTAVPINKISTPINLRKCMHYCLTNNLQDLYEQKHSARNNDKTTKETADKERIKVLANYYEDFFSESFKWLLNDDQESGEFIEDIIDTIRLLRAADAFRQRGTALKTSANYQIFIDQVTGNAIYALTNDKDKLFLLEVHKPINAAEANLENLDISPEGDLMFAFSRGSFATAAATETAIGNMAALVDDIQADVIGSFYKAPGTTSLTEEYVKKNKYIYLVLESTDDNPQFSTKVAKKLIQRNPDLEKIIRIIPSLRKISDTERFRYLSAKLIDWSLANKKDLLTKIGQTGHKIDSISATHAFSCCKLAHLEPQDILMHAGDFAGFVYIPLQAGLAGQPLGGYARFQIAPFIPLGNVGVIRGDVRNATIIAEKALDVVIIPKETYLKYWNTRYKVSDIYEMATLLKS